jgi:signal transduction histidine kinase
VVVTRRGVLAYAAGLLGACCTLAAVAFAIGAGPRLAGSEAIAPFIILAPLVTVGVLVTVRRPDNAVGPVLLVGGLAFAALQAANWYAILALIARPGTPGGIWALVATQALWPVGYLFMFALLPLLFPDGRFLSRRWRWLALFMAGLCVVPVALAPLSPTIQAGPGTIANPIGVLDPRIGHPIETVWYLLFSAGVLAAVGSMGPRYRRAEPDERRRIRWVVASLALTVVATVARQVAQILQPELELPFEVVLAAFGTIPLAIGVAVLRNRLFDIDLVLRRSLVYGVLWLGIVAVYVGMAAALGLAAGQRLSVGAAVVVTIVATLIFQPARTRLERLADRVAYGRRGGAYELLRDFGSATERTVAVEEIGPRLAAAARAGLGARWVRVHVPSDIGGGPSLLGAAGEPSGPVALSAPLVRDGENVGWIECGPRSEGAYSGRDRDVLATLGRQAALAIHNAGLNAELLRRVEVVERQARELAESRSRIVQTQEAERRRIERDLHDGVQQQLISLVANVRLARNRLPGTAGAADDALEGVQGQALHTLRDLRELVRGIHPAVLSDGGIVSAIEARSAQLPLEVTIDVDARTAARRYPPAVEGALYFVVSEALANVMKHAGGSSASVSLRDTGSSVVLTVADQGGGFCPEAVDGSGLRGLRDRVSALAGELEVRSAPGRGTTLTATLPVVADD